MQHTLSLDDIHSKWRLNRPVILPLIPVAQFAYVRNPIVLQGRGRSMGASNNSTCRDTSGFELVEMQIMGIIVSLCCERNMPQLQDLS